MKPHCQVYARRGDLHEQEIPPYDEGAVPAPEATIADRVPITQVMTRAPICAHANLRIDTLAQLMIEKHVGCVPVIDERGRPHGIVTKFDLVEQMARVHDGALTAGDVMMPLAITLDEHATVAHAAAMMALEDLHHVMVVGAGGQLIGVVSSKDIVRWLVDNDQLTS
jgi:CBS domain-containing protein